MHIAHCRQVKEAAHVQARSGHVQHTHDHVVELPALADLAEPQPVDLQHASGDVI
jgi:hypothetical protein